MQTLLITLLTLSTGVLSYALVNLLKKYEKLEQEIENLEETFLQTYLRMKEIDTMGAFASDDEVGGVFDDLKDVIYKTQKLLEDGKKKEG